MAPHLPDASPRHRRARVLFALGALLATAAFSGPAQPPAQKWALLVGVSDYQNFGDEEGGDLPGAADDARRMREVLVARWGFRPDHVRLLTDTAATRDAIHGAFSGWLGQQARPGDLVVFYFSGHGSQTFDRDGDESDGLDETLCPTDVLRGNASRDILDDELGAWIRALPTTQVTVILDSCHSGTATRSAAPFARRKALGRPAEAGAAAVAGAPNGSSADNAGAEVLEIAAADAGQYALETRFEDNGVTRPGGAFTVPLVRLMWQLDPSTSYAQLFALTRAEMRRSQFEQTPQLSAVPARDRPAFSLAGASAAADPSPGPARVTSVRGTRVLLGAGSAAGVRPGWLYRAGTALLRVVAVAADSALAQAVVGVPSVGAAATLVGSSLEPEVLRVSADGLPGEAAVALRAAVPPGIEVDGSDDPARPATLRVRPEGGDWVVLDADGGERARVSAADAAAAARGVAAVLGREQRLQRLAALENPARPFALALSFGGGRDRFRIGETVTLVMQSGRAGYLTLLDQDPAGRLSVVYPNRYEPDGRVAAGSTVTLPSPAMGFDFRVDEPVGRGVVRAFLTRTPLQLPGDPGSGLEVEAVERALRAAAGPSPLAGSQVVPLDGWATAYVVYEFVR